MISRDEILKPIPGDNPGGENLRYAPVYTQIREAVREDDDVSQGVWQTERKVADWPKVVKLCTDALTKQSKDLQLVAWLTEAETNREGFSGFLGGVNLISAMLDQFWENLHPELEDGDAEMRAVPLLYVSSKLEMPLRRTPITATGLNWLKYKEATTVPSEEDAASDDSKSKARSAAIQDGKTTPEDIADALKATPSTFLDDRKATLAECIEAIEALDNLCNDKFADYAPNFRPIKDCLAELANSVRILKQRRTRVEAHRPNPVGSRRRRPRQTRLLPPPIPLALPRLTPSVRPRRPTPSPQLLPRTHLRPPHLMTPLDPARPRPSNRRLPARSAIHPLSQTPLEEDLAARLTRLRHSSSTGRSGRRGLPAAMASRPRMRKTAHSESPPPRNGCGRRIPPTRRHTCCCGVGDGVNCGPPDLRRTGRCLSPLRWKSVRR